MSERLTPEEIDIKNLNFYADLFKANKWGTDIIDYRVFVVTLREIAERYAALRADLAAAQHEIKLLNGRLAEVDVLHPDYGRELAEAKGRASYRCRDCGARWAVHHAPLCPLGLNAEEALKSTPEG